MDEQSKKPDLSDTPDNAAGVTEKKTEYKHVPLPQVTFSTFILSLASSALVQLGEVPNPEDGQTVQELELAKHSIDILSMLQEKIQNGLEDDEKRLIDGLLYELRMKYVLKAE